MNGDLLPYKYKALKLSSQYTSKGVVRLGWQCRKYIKWSDVHVGDDRKVLKSFGDTAVDDEKIDSALFPVVNKILLNVQKWRLDKDEWSIEPPHEQSWDVANEILAAAQSSPSIATKYMYEYFGSLEEICDDDLFEGFVNLLLTQLVVSVNKIKDFTISASDVALGLEYIIADLEAHGYSLPELECIRNKDNIDEVALAFGLEIDHIDRDLRVYRTVSVEKSPEIRFREEHMAASRLFRVHDVKEVRTIYLNSNNRCVIYAEKNPDIGLFLQKFLTSYLETIEDNPAISENFEDFNSYLAMNLNRNF